MNADDSVIGRIETEVALLMRFAEATRRATPVEAHRSLDRAAYVILRYLDEAGPQNVSALAARLNLDGSTVTRQVGAMEREGLIAREADPNDGRGTLVSATASGLRRMSTVRMARAEIYDEMLASWSETDRAELATMLTRLNEALAARSQARRRP
ncbi:MarR family transcriptional regulator [Asanoa ishikariensis]|uniref:DNA-binding transcriptional regulator, MarR family n=1 Tax=Asanoa ishikariensis TaxID=137265 RepID=A0A1H3NYN6_9ACTN|nr:MarR family transcriptional regulator [Asanoa ishikariensis]GIF68254.1 MarR family transcriptional regulator [Asanoa ishikariensis]SDY93840.1 DNA-binding transcriptional regulator, MarR family [Asanoa ishikariensis]